MLPITHLMLKHTDVIYTVMSEDRPGRLWLFQFTFRDGAGQDLTAVGAERSHSG